MGKGFRVTIKTLNSEVTGSGTILKIKRPGKQYERIIIDTGGFQESTYEYLNEQLDFNPSELSYAIITHAHYDHIARIPFLVKNGFHREVYCSPICKKSIPINLRDILKIMQSDYDKHGIEMLYTQKEVNETETLLKSIEYNLPTHVSRGVKLTFLGNGHLYGATSILLQISCPKYKDKNILITGDYYPTNDLFKVPDIPNWVKKLEDLTIIQESTYGDTSRESVEKILDKHILTSTLSGKNILMPVISQERLELVLLRLKGLQDKNLLSSNIKIFIHTELGKQYLNTIYLNNKEIIDFMPKNVEQIAKGDFETVLNYTGQNIILSSSGMADRGAVRFYLKNLIIRDDYSIIFTCYTPKGTLGYKLRNMTKNEYVKIADKTVPLVCEVKHSGELSRHVKFEDIVDYIDQFESVKNILLTHGETKTKSALFNRLQKVYPDKNIYITNRETGFKLDANMDITPYATNFICKPDLRTKNEKKKTKKSFKKTVKRRNY